MILHLLACAGPAWIQDLGRPGRMIEGIPPGGALVPEALAHANRRVGNPPGAPGIEAFGELVIAARGGRLAVAWGDDAFYLDRDHVRRLHLAGGVTTLAVGGGLLVPEVLGGRGLLVTAGIGGLGRPLRAGDGLPVGALRGQARPVEGPPSDHGPIRVVRGPDLDDSAFAALLAGPWCAGPGDRVGQRLVGARIPRSGVDSARSAPMVRGAVQVPAGGGPIVLGPDHPTTGGYPVVAVVITADQGRLARVPPGEPVRFISISVDEARTVTHAWRRAALA